MLPDAIDLNGMSCHRQHFCAGPQVALAVAQLDRPGDDRVAAARYGDIPAEELVAPGGSRWQFYVEDLPTEAIPAHCEIRFRKPGEQTQGRAKKQGARDFLRAILIAAFRVVHPPL